MVGARSCAKGGDAFQSYADCMLRCTCAIDLNATDYLSYCSDAFRRNPSARWACLCLASRCQASCVDQVPCPKSGSYDEQCWKTEDLMPCDIGCAPRPSGSSGSSFRPPMLAWNFSRTPCVTDIVEEVWASTEYIDAQNRLGPSREMFIVGGALLVVLLCFCGITGRRMHRKWCQQQLQAQQEQGDVESPAPLPSAAANSSARRPNAVAAPAAVSEEAVPDVASMSVRALKELISSAGLSFEDCIERPELIARAKQAALGRRHIILET